MEIAFILFGVSALLAVIYGLAGSCDDIATACAIMACLTLVGIFLSASMKHEFHNVTIKAHYINGDVVTMRLDTIPIDYPEVFCHRGAYWLETGRSSYIGVVRFEIIDEEKFTK